MNIDHRTDEINRESEYNSESDNEDDDDSDPTPGVCFHQVSYHMNNDAGHLNSYWILLNNKSMVHMFSCFDVLVGTCELTHRSYESTLSSFESTLSMR